MRRTGRKRKRIGRVHLIYVMKLFLKIRNTSLLRKLITLMYFTNELRNKARNIDDNFLLKHVDYGISLRQIWQPIQVLPLYEGFDCTWLNVRNDRVHQF